MAFVVEDGTGIADANSLSEVGETDVYWADRGSPAQWTSATTSQKEAALVKATDLLERRYRTRWVGFRATETQSLSWPRVEAVTLDDQEIMENEVPTLVIQACAELALRALTSDLDPDPKYSGAVKAERKKVGPIETERQYDFATTTRRFPTVERLVAPLLKDVNRAYR